MSWLTYPMDPMNLISLDRKIWKMSINKTSYCFHLPFIINAKHWHIGYLRQDFPIFQNRLLIRYNPFPCKIFWKKWNIWKLSVIRSFPGIGRANWKLTICDALLDNLILLIHAIRRVQQEHLVTNLPWHHAFQILWISVPILINNITQRYLSHTNSSWISSYPLRGLLIIT